MYRRELPDWKSEYLDPELETMTREQIEALQVERLKELMSALCNFKWNVGILAPVRPQHPISFCKYHLSVHQEPHQTGFSFLLLTAKHNFKNSGVEEWSILCLNPYPSCDSFLILGSFCLKHLFQQILFSKAAGDRLTKFSYIRDVFVSPSSLKSILTGIKL